MNPSVYAGAPDMLRGFDVAFCPRDDHPLGILEVHLKREIDQSAPQRVYVDVTFGLRDRSNEWDDPYEEKIMFAVIAE